MKKKEVKIRGPNLGRLLEIKFSEGEDQSCVGLYLQILKKASGKARRINLSIGQDDISRGYIHIRISEAWRSSGYPTPNRFKTHLDRLRKKGLVVRKIREKDKGYVFRFFVPDYDFVIENPGYESTGEMS